MRVVRLGMWAFGIILLLELVERLTSGALTDPANMVRVFWVSLVVTQAQVLTFGITIYLALLGWRPRERRGVAWTAGLAVLLLVGAIAAELGTELLLGNPAAIPSFMRGSFREYYARHDRAIIQTLPECSVYDPGLLYVLRPGHCSFKNREFDTDVRVNRLGVRDDEQSLDQPEIVVLGDSYAMGWGVEQEETFAQGIERLTGRLVLNAGVSSFGTAREIGLLSRIDRSRTDYLVIQYHETDLAENRAFRNGDNEMPIPEEARYQAAVTAAGLIRRYYPGKHLIKMTSALGRRLLFAPLARFSKPAAAAPDQPSEAALFLNVLQARSADTDGMHILVTELGPSRGHKRSFLTELREELRKPEFAELANRITIVDVSDRIGPDEMFILDRHINAAGHAAVAEAIADAIAAVEARTDEGDPVRSQAG